MRLNDPFGRLERRHQAGYEAMRDALRQAGVATPAAAHGIIIKARKRGLVLVSVCLLSSLLAALLLSKMAPLVIALSLFLLVWVATSTLNGQRYIQRYIEEELNS